MDEQLSAYQPPHSLEAEQAVLGSILIDSRCLTEIIGVLKPEDFYQEQNRELFETIYTMFNFSQTIDPVTVLDKLKELGYYHDNSSDYILQLMEITPTAANALRYANIVKDKAMLRGLAEAAGDITQIVHEQVGTPAEMLETAEKKIYALRKGERGDSLEHIGTVLHKVFDRLDELSQSDSAIPSSSPARAPNPRTTTAAPTTLSAASSGSPWPAWTRRKKRTKISTPITWWMKSPAAPLLPHGA